MGLDQTRNNNDNNVSKPIVTASGRKIKSTKKRKRTSTVVVDETKPRVKKEKLSPKIEPKQTKTTNTNSTTTTTTTTTNSNSSTNANNENSKERNRQAAKQFRARQKLRVKKLEADVQMLHESNQKELKKQQQLQVENIALKKQIKYLRKFLRESKQPKNEQARSSSVSSSSSSSSLPSSSSTELDENVISLSEHMKTVKSLAFDLWKSSESKPVVTHSASSSNLLLSDTIEDNLEIFPANSLSLASIPVENAVLDDAIQLPSLTTPQLDQSNVDLLAPMTMNNAQSLFSPLSL